MLSGSTEPISIGPVGVPEINDTAKFKYCGTGPAALHAEHAEPLKQRNANKNGNSEGKTQLIKSSKPSAAPAAACGPKSTSPKQRIAVTATKNTSYNEHMR